jgi:hypothetical protein
MTTDTKKPKHLGLHTYRFSSNPEEERFAEAWAAQNTDQGFGGSNTLAWLLGVADQWGRPVDPTDREHSVAATVVQWLGSPVGQCFLRDLGYEKQEKKR